jgi:hypothetical protein
LLSTVVLVVLLWVSVTDVGDLNLAVDAVKAGTKKCVDETSPWSPLLT